MKEQSAILKLEEIAASQWGMFTTAQAQKMGVRRNEIARLAANGRIEPLCYGVYHFTAGAEPEQLFLKAHWLAVFPDELAYERLRKSEPDAVVAGITAAWALGAGDFHASPYTFIVDGRKQTKREDVRYFKQRISEVDFVYVDGIPVTSFERTVYDLLRTGEDPDLVDGFMQDAAWKGKHAFDLDRLGSFLSPLAERFGFGRRKGVEFAANLLARNTAAAQLLQARNSMEALARSFPDDRVVAALFRMADEIVADLDSLPPDMRAEAQKMLESITALVGSSNLSGCIPKSVAY